MGTRGSVVGQAFSPSGRRLRAGSLPAIPASKSDLLANAFELPYKLPAPIAVNRPPQNREFIRLVVAVTRGPTPHKGAIRKHRKVFQIFLDLQKKFPNSRA